MEILGASAGPVGDAEDISNLDAHAGGFGVQAVTGIAVYLAISTLFLVVRCLMNRSPSLRYNVHRKSIRNLATVQILQ